MVHMDIPEEVARAFIGPRAPYYLRRWARIEQGRSPTLGFNWAAFFWTVFWMLYRWMYWPFWITTASLAALTVLEGLLLRVPAQVDVALNVVFVVTMGTFANYWYYRHALKQWRQATATGDVLPQHLAARGGTRVWPVLLAAFGLFVLLYLALGTA